MDKSGEKILYVLHWFPALSETFILREILELQKMGDDVDVISLNPAPDTIVHPEFEQFKGKIYQHKGGVAAWMISHLYWMTSRPEVYFPILFSIISKISHPKTVTVSLRVFTKILTMARRLRTDKYSHIHAHFGTAPATGAWILAKLLDIPFSFTLHAVGVFLPDRLLVKKVADSKFVAVISNFNINYLKERFPSIDASKFHIVRCGIKPDEFQFSPMKPVSDPVKLLSVGRMVETKGFRDLLHAMQILSKLKRKYKLTLVGGGEKLYEFKNLANELGISESVTFTGPLPQNQVQELMRDADLFILAASVAENGDRDGIPVVLMESLALGIPTISTEVSGIPELIVNFDTGLLVPEKSPQSLADAIMIFVNETDLRKRLTQNGRKMVETQFNVVSNTKKLRELIGGSS